MSNFHFLRPWWFLALLPMLLILLAYWRRRSGGSTWRSVLDPALLERLWLEPPGRVSRLPLWLLALGWLLFRLQRREAAERGETAAED